MYVYSYYFLDCVLHLYKVAHEHTTAHIVTAAAEALGLSDRLKLHEADAFDPDLPSTLAPGTEFDLLWIDLVGITTNKHL